MAHRLELDSSRLPKVLAAAWFAFMAMIGVIVPFLTGPPVERWLPGNIILTGFLALGAVWVWVVARSGFGWLERQHDAVSLDQRRREHHVALGGAVAVTYIFALLSALELSLAGRVLSAVWDCVWLALPLGMPVYFLIRVLIRTSMVFTR